MNRVAPASATVVSHRRPKQLRDIYRKVLIDLARFFTPQNPFFQLFNSQRFQSNDLLFSDSTVDFNLLNDRTSYTNYLGIKIYSFLLFSHLLPIDLFNLFRK